MNSRDFVNFPFSSFTSYFMLSKTCLSYRKYLVINDQINSFFFSHGISNLQIQFKPFTHVCSSILIRENQDIKIVSNSVNKEN